MCGVRIVDIPVFGENSVTWALVKLQLVRLWMASEWWLKVMRLLVDCLSVSVIILAVGKWCLVRTLSTVLLMVLAVFMIVTPTCMILLAGVCGCVWSCAGWLLDF